MDTMYSIGGHTAVAPVGRPPCGPETTKTPPRSRHHLLAKSPPPTTMTLLAPPTAPSDRLFPEASLLPKMRRSACRAPEAAASQGGQEATAIVFLVRSTTPDMSSRISNDFKRGPCYDA